MTEEEQEAAKAEWRDVIGSIKAWAAPRRCALSERELDVFMAGMLSGYIDGEGVGYRRGREAVEAELALSSEQPPAWCTAWPITTPTRRRSRPWRTSPARPGRTWQH